jgi:hypothetical protein
MRSEKTFDWMFSDVMKWNEKRDKIWRNTIQYNTIQHNTTKQYEIRWDKRYFRDTENAKYEIGAEKKLDQKFYDVIKRDIIR